MAQLSFSFRLALNPRPVNSGGNRIAWLLCLFFSVCHVLSLPLDVTYDSHWYARLADVLGTHHFPEEWDFLRTPLFPLMLKLAFWLWGRQVMAIFALQACLACAGIWLLARTLQSLELRVESAIATILIAAFPTLIVYEHLLMSEVGSFFFFSLLLSLMVKPKDPSVAGSVWVALAVAASFYYRSSFLYLAPLLALIYICKGLNLREKRAFRAWWTPFARTTLAQFLIIAIVPFALAWPWQRNPKVTQRTGSSVILYGLLKQGVLTVNDPVLAETAPIYARAIEDSKVHGVFPNAGISNGREGLAMAKIYPLGSVASSIFLRSVRTDPWKYWQAVLRNVVLFSEFGSQTYDNEVYRHRILYGTSSQIDPGPAWLYPLADEYKRATPASFTSRLLRKICPPYDWMVRIGLLATVLAFFLGLWRLDAVILTFTAPALAFMAIHALLLMSQDRMIVPVQPILLLNLVVLPAWIKRAFAATRFAWPQSFALSVPFFSTKAEPPRESEPMALSQAHNAESGAKRI